MNLLQNESAIQCKFPKFENDDLFPNIKLQQVIDCFLEVQMTTSFYIQQQLPSKLSSNLDFRVGGSYASLFTSQFISLW